MPRPVEFDRAVVLEQAMEIFWRRGYEATSLQDLLAGMGLSKSSFYQTFDSKEELFRNCLLHYQEMLATEFAAGLDRAPSALRFLEDYLLAIADNRNEDAMKGCLLMNTASEFAQRNPAIAQTTRNGIDALTRLLSGAVRQAQEERDIPKAADADELGIYLIATVSGLKTLAKAGTPKNKLRATAQAAIAYLGKAA